MDDKNKSPIQPIDLIEEQIKAAVPGAHIVRERLGECRFCGREDDLRYQACFECVNAQAIIGIGEDMYGDGDKGVEIPAQEASSRLRQLLKDGWVHKDWSKGDGHEVSPKH